MSTVYTPRARLRFHLHQNKFGITQCKSLELLWIYIDATDIISISHFSRVDNESYE